MAEPGRGGGLAARVDVREVLLPDGYAPRQYSWDDGYFSYRGGGVAMRDGKARFDYDRSYPYEFVPVADEPEPEAYVEERVPSCELTPARGPDGREAMVRICRN